MKVNKQIRAHRVRLVNQEGQQLGIVAIDQALRLAAEKKLDLVEVVPNADPPVSKIMDFGKFRYDQAKREKESKRSQHQAKLKEVKVKPNIDKHDLDFKLRHARQFLEKGNKVKVTCFFRGRQRAYPEHGQAVLDRVWDELKDCAQIEAEAKMVGRTMQMVLAPMSGAIRRVKTGNGQSQERPKSERSSAESEDPVPALKNEEEDREGVEK